MTATHQTTRPMLSPAAIKSFKEDFEIARRSSATAAVYLQFEDHLREASEGLKKTWLAAMECGAALKRMHDSKSYHENFSTWREVCESLHVSRSHADRLMECSVILESLPRELIGQIAMPLSFRRMEVLGEATDEQRREVLGEVASEPAAADEAFSRLRDTLKATSAASKNGLVSTAAETKKKPRKRGVEWARKQAENLLAWFVERDDYEGKAHLEVIVKHLAVLRE